MSVCKENSDFWVKSWLEESCLVVVGVLGQGGFFEEVTQHMLLGLSDFPLTASLLKTGWELQAGVTGSCRRPCSPVTLNLKNFRHCCYGNFSGDKRCLVNYALGTKSEKIVVGEVSGGCPSFSLEIFEMSGRYFHCFI